MLLVTDLCTLCGFVVGDYHRAPDLQEVIEYLSSPDDSIKANAAAYLQHLSFNDDGIKAKTRYRSSLMWARCVAQATVGGIVLSCAVPVTVAIKVQKAVEIMSSLFVEMAGCEHR